MATEKYQLEMKLSAIMTKLKDALADEEEAVPFYRGLQTEIETAMAGVDKRSEKYRYLYAAWQMIGAISVDESRHHHTIGNLITAFRELQRTVELERTTGRQQVLRPLERV